MATRKRTTKSNKKKVTKKVVKKKVTRVPEVTLTPENLLKVLYRIYDFGPAMNKRLDQTLNKVDPMLRPPAFLGTNGNPLTFDTRNDDIRRLVLGHIDGYLAILRHIPKDGRTPAYTRFIWGCRDYTNQSHAREHWIRNVSMQSHRARPHATELMNYADSICRYLGWKW